MNTLQESEAIALLSQPATCIDIGDWISNRQQPDTWECTSGVLNAENVRTGLIVELAFRRSQKTQKVHYKFSVFRQTLWGLERVYQLDIQQFKKPLRNAHDVPHEHVGDRRVCGDATWGQWTFHEALQYFTERTKINFSPEVPHPEAFELKG